MSMSILNNISSLSAQNALNSTSANLSSVLQKLSSGSRINSGADDAAGLSIANGLTANTTALTQSAQNTTDSVGMLQVADGAMSQVTTLLNRAVTLATEAANGTVNTTQQAALDNEFTSIKNEINRIGSNTTYNGSQVFSNTASSAFISDGTTTGSSMISTTVGNLSSSQLGFSSGTTAVDITNSSLTSVSNATNALTKITSAISNIASDRGALGAVTNRLTAATNVVNNQVQNLTSAEDSISSANIAQEVANMTKYNILQSTGMAALQQSNQAQQSILKLLQ